MKKMQKNHLIKVVISIKWIWKKIKAFCKYIWTECKDWHTLILFIIVWLIMATPTWLGYILYWIFKWKWSLYMATGSLFFWNVIPCTPYIPICLAITLGIKKLKNKHKQVKQEE